MNSSDQTGGGPPDASRRRFVQMIGRATAGLVMAPYIRGGSVFGYRHTLDGSLPFKVAITGTSNTPADTYDPASVKAKVQYLFEQLGGISDIVTAGAKVVIKINLTGGSGNASSQMLKGVPITEAMWTHPAVLQAVGQLLIDAGVKGSDITIVDSLWDTGSTAPFGANDAFGYTAVVKALGCNVIDLNNAAPYASFASLSTGSSPFHSSSLTMNQILKDATVYISIPKLKQHAEAGLTSALKNQVGTVPKSLYTIPSNTSRRQALHNPTGGASNAYLPQSICDLNAARPVHIAVIDAIKNSRGGEGVWIPTFVPSASHALLAGKEPVSTDSIGAVLIGLNPQASTLPLPDGTSTCTNYLDLMHSRGTGSNQLADISVVGDGAGLVTGVQNGATVRQPDAYMLLPNYPNPFNPSTRITFFMPRAGNATVRVYSLTGEEIQTLVHGEVPAGRHELYWSADNLASGVYVCRMEAQGFSAAIRMMHVK